MELRAGSLLLSAGVLSLALLGGCHYGTDASVGSRVQGLASCPLDVTPPPARPAKESAEETKGAPAEPLFPPPSENPMSSGTATPKAAAPSQVRPAAFEDVVAKPAAPALGPEPQGKPLGRLQHPLEIPKDLPGSEAPPIRVPPLLPEAPDGQRQSEIQKLFAELAIVPPVAGPRPTPGQSPMTLDQLQQLAMSRNPLIRQAASDVEAARGAMIQAGTYPNPHVGLQDDTVNTGRTGGYQGGNISQTIVTGGKLRLAKNAAAMDVQNAELAFRRAKYDLATQVRTNYLATLVALERVKVNKALVDFADGIYRAQITRVKAGQAAPYEPLQLRVLATQAQTQLIQSNHEYEAAWRRLATTLSCPEMPPTALAGQVDGPVPQITYEAARDRILRCHTDLVTAQNDVAKARYQLRLAKITPICPNVDTTVIVQHDYTVAPFATVYGLQIGAPIPIFDQNRGNILSADAALVRASSEYERARNDLLSSLADTFARYQTNSATLQSYRDSILIDQVRAYRGMYQRYQSEPDADFNDVITAQQTLATVVTSYIQILGDQWLAVVDLAGLLQIDDLFRMGQPDMGQPEVIEAIPQR